MIIVLSSNLTILQMGDKMRSAATNSLVVERYEKTQEDLFYFTNAVLNDKQKNKNVSYSSLPTILKRFKLPVLD